MENATTRPEEGDLGLLESVFPGSVTFDENILTPLKNNYLYEESKECFTYKSAYLINNAVLQKRYAAFRTQKRKKGYSEQELEETFGFLLFDDLNKAKKVGATGLLVGQAKCTTLGDNLKGVYISKYSDCLDLRRWYDGKTGYIVLVKLIKGRVKQVTDNYTQNYTPPTAGFDCHLSEQLAAVTSTTSSFLAYQRTQYYLYELTDGSSETQLCPRQACPFAVVAFSYALTAAPSGLEEQRQEKSAFRYKPWNGQLKIESAVYDVGLQSASGAWFPTKLPKTVQIDHAIGVTELKKTLPREIFATCLVGEVCIGGRCFNLYDVVSSKAKHDLAQITQELKEQELALVIPLHDSGFLILLHSSHLFSYEDAISGKADALQGMFIFPDSRAVPRDAKYEQPKLTVSTDVIQVIPAFNYAESEMEKYPPDQQGAPHATVEKHLQNYGTLIQPGLNAANREASMFPDQYDVPSGFTLIAPKWTQEAGTRLKSYFDESCGFTVPVVKALELLAAGRQQRGNEQDDDVCYYISSPEEVPQASADVVMDGRKQTFRDGRCASGVALENVVNSEDEHKRLSVKQLQPALPESLGRQGTAVITVTNSVSEYPTSTVSPKLGDVPTENSVRFGTDDKVIPEGRKEVILGLSLKETPVQTSSTQLITSMEEGVTALRREDNIHAGKTMADPDTKLGWRSLPKGRRKMRQKTMPVKQEGQNMFAGLPLSLAVNSTETMMEGARNDQTESHSQTESAPADHITQRPHLTHRGKGRRRRGVNRNLSKTREERAPIKSTAAHTYVPAETLRDQGVKTDSVSSLKRDWRSLPRRKRLWNADASLKRCLRSDVLRNSNRESRIDCSEGGLSGAPQRIIEGINQKKRCGLKTVITKCGRVFVPHGTDVASEDEDSSNKGENEITNEQMYIDRKAHVFSIMEKKSTELVKSRGESSSEVAVVSKGGDSSDLHCSSKDKSGVKLVLPIKKLGKRHNSRSFEVEKCLNLTAMKLESMTTASNEAECLQHTNKDYSVDVQPVPDQSISTLPKIRSPEKSRKKTKHAVYRAISISKLKTVLLRGKRATSPSSADETSETNNAEFKKSKCGVTQNLKQDNISNEELKDNGSQSVSSDSQHTSMSREDQETMKTAERSKGESVSWRGLINKTSNEKGSVTFHTSAPFEIIKHANEHLVSSFLGDGVGGISSDVKGGTQKMTPGATPVSDALSLLADLALGASTDKTLTDIESKPSQKSTAGVSGSGPTKSVPHAVVWCPSTQFKLPSRSPFPEGLLVTGELILEISKEHSYSQPYSLLSGLSGTSPQVCSPSGCVESPLSLRTGLHLNLPVDPTTSLYPKEGGKTEWKSLISPNGPLPTNVKRKTRRARILRHRRIVEKEGSIQVVRTWRETYEFKYDSMFTNDNLDKTIMRALHGKWNFDIEDTYEDVHLVFHMWIGLFYSMITSRLFHLENCTALPEGKSNTKRQQDGDLLQSPASSLNVELNPIKESPKALHLGPEILDLSVKNSEPGNLHLVSEQNRGDDTASHPGVKSLEVTPKHLPSGNNLSSCPKVTALMEYRSAVDVQVENMASDDEDDFSVENDIITDCSYTQLLEGNAAYNKLCEQASNMSISVEPHPPNILNISRNVAPTRAPSFDPKEMGVFHRLISPIKPSAVFKRPGLVLSYDQSFKDKAGAHVVQQNEDVSVNAENKPSLEAHRTQDRCSMSDGDGSGNVDKTLECTTAARSPVSVRKESVSEMKVSRDVSDEDSQDRCLTIVENETLEENKTSRRPGRDQCDVEEHNETHHPEFKPSLELKDETDEGDSYVEELKDNPSPKTKVEEQNKTINANGEHIPLVDLEDCASVVDASSHSIERNTTKETAEGDESSAVEEMMQEAQSKSEDRTKLDGNDSGCEISTTVVDHDDFDLNLKDSMESVDMEISDEDSSDQILDELNTPSIRSVVSETINCVSNNEDDDVKIEKSKAQPNTPMNLGDDSSEETEVLCSGNVSLPVCQSVCVEEETSSAPNNDISEASTQNRSENMTPGQRFVEQEAALDICVEPKSTSIIESSNLEMSHSERDEECDLGHQDTSGNDENVHGNDIQSQTSYSSDDKPLAMDTYQKCRSPQICASLPNSPANSGGRAAAPQTLARAVEGEVNSMCSTPTQDEVSFDQPTHFTVYNTSEVLEDSYEPKKKEWENFYWTKNNDKSEHSSANRRGDHFKCQTKVTYSPQYASTIDILEADPVPEKRSRIDRFTGVFCNSAEWNEEDSLFCTVNYNISKASRLESNQTKPTRTVTVNSLSHVQENKQRFDWRRYFTREADSRQLFDSDSEGHNKFDIPPSSIVTVLDKKGNRVTFDNSTTMNPFLDANRITTRSEDSSSRWQDQQSKVDMTQSAVDLEYLIFSEELNRILKESKDLALSSVSARSHFRSNAVMPITVRFSNLSDLESSAQLSIEQTSLNKLKIKVDLSDRKRPLRHCCETSSEEDCFRISEISVQCASDRSRMNDACTRKNLSGKTEGIKRKWGQDNASQDPGFSGRIRENNLYNNLHFTERQASNIKYRFYILVTSTDTFFEETKKLLMMEGHVPVEPDGFDLSGSNPSSLLIILRNEDIVEHICEVPYLLELKKSSGVMFAGIDQPDDLVNLTHQELFANGGFIVCDELALDTLTLDNMKKVVGILQELGKWKWFLHYKDSRKLRESARSNHEAGEKQHFIDYCQESGIVEVLPYHHCDVISHARPDYLFCLTHLQIQNASVRFPVFVTDNPSHPFEKNGILTMNVHTFSRILSKDTCSVS